MLLKFGRKLFSFPDVFLLLIEIPVALLIVFVLYNHDHYTTSITRGAIYFGAPLSVFMVAFAGHFLADAWRKSLIISLYSVFLAVYAVEAYFEFLVPAHGDDFARLGETIDSAKLDIDRRTKQQVVLDLRKDGKRAFPAVVPSVRFVRGVDGKLHSRFSVDGRATLTLGGIANAWTVMCNETGRFAVHHSDRHGFINPDALWDEAETDLLLLGDSFTQGFCVEPGHSFADLIRKGRPRTINLGNAGNGPLAMLAGLAEFGSLRKPRHTIWFFFEGNDLPDDMKFEWLSPDLVGYLDPLSGPRVANHSDQLSATMADYLETRYAVRQQDSRFGFGLIQRALYFIGAGALRQRIFGHDRSMLKTLTPKFKQVLARAKALTAGWGGDLTVVYIPTANRFGTDLGYVNQMRLNEILALVQAACRDLEIALIDDLARLTDKDDPLSLYPFRQFGHFDEDGHALTAQLVLSHLAGR